MHIDHSILHTACYTIEKAIACSAYCKGFFINLMLHPIHFPTEFACSLVKENDIDCLNKRALIDIWPYRWSATVRCQVGVIISVLEHYTVTSLMVTVNPNPHQPSSPSGSNKEKEAVSGATVTRVAIVDNVPVNGSPPSKSILFRVAIFWHTIVPLAESNEYVRDPMEISVKHNYNNQIVSNYLCASHKWKINSFQLTWEGGSFPLKWGWVKSSLYPVYFDNVQLSS